MRWHGGHKDVPIKSNLEKHTASWLKAQDDKGLLNKDISNHEIAKETRVLLRAENPSISSATPFKAG
jgi:hypothetical protein